MYSVAPSFSPLHAFRRMNLLFVSVFCWLFATYSCGRLVSSLHGSGSTIFVPGFDCDSIELYIGGDPPFRVRCVSSPAPATGISTRREVGRFLQSGRPLEVFLEGLRSRGRRQLRLRTGLLKAGPAPENSRGSVGPEEPELVLSKSFASFTLLGPTSNFRALVLFFLGGGVPLLK